MCGNATLAIEESSTTMNVANITESATIHGFTDGRHSTVTFPGFRAAALAVLILRLSQPSFLRALPLDLFFPPGPDPRNAEQRKSGGFGALRAFAIANFAISSTIHSKFSAPIE